VKGTAVPEPASLALLLIATVAVIAIRRPSSTAPPHVSEEARKN